MFLFLMVACRRITRGVIFREIPCKVINMGLRVWRIRITLRMSMMLFGLDEIDKMGPGGEAHTMGVY